MSLRRYDSPGLADMDESPTGEFVRLEDVIELLEKHRISIKDISQENWIGLWHDAIRKIKGEQK